MKNLNIPVGISDFERIRELNYYYVDKTDFIPSLEDYNAPVFSVPGVSARVCLSLPWRVTMTAPRPIGSRSCSAGLGSVSTRRRNIIGIWSCAMISPRW